MDISVEGNEADKVITFQARPGAQITQEDLLQERMLTHAAETAIKLRDAKRDWLRESLSRGARVESGPLKAELRKRFNRRRGTRRKRDDDSYSVLVVYV